MLPNAEVNTAKELTVTVSPMCATSVGVPLYTIVVPVGVVTPMFAPTPGLQACARAFPAESRAPTATIAERLIAMRFFGVVQLGFLIFSFVVMSLFVLFC